MLSFYADLITCLRCLLLSPDPPQRARLIEVRDNLLARIAEARWEGWLGDADGLLIGFDGTRPELAQLDQLAASAASTGLSMPSFSRIAGRRVSPLNPPS
ncbi:MAG: hypothetical protein J2P19_19715 [Pseudonocardia sp.]|nr:hypothetical protein [Pseudonocardia sp.]